MLSSPHYPSVQSFIQPIHVGFPLCAGLCAGPWASVVSMTYSMLPRGANVLGERPNEGNFIYFILLKIFSDMDHFFKVFMEFVAVVLLFYVWVFWL